MNPNGGGFAATVLPSERRAGYGAAPPASRVATAIATRRALRPALDPGALYGPSPRSGRRAGAKPLPAQPHGAHDPNPTKQSLYGYRGLPQGALRPQRRHAALRGRTRATTSSAPSAPSSSNSMPSITVCLSTPNSPRHNLTLRTSLPAPSVPDP